LTVFDCNGIVYLTFETVAHSLCVLVVCNLVLISTVRIVRKMYKASREFEILPLQSRDNMGCMPGIHVGPNQHKVIRPSRKIPYSFKIFYACAGFSAKTGRN